MRLPRTRLSVRHDAPIIPLQYPTHYFFYVRVVRHRQLVLVSSRDAVVRKLMPALRRHAVLGDDQSLARSQREFARYERSNDSDDFDAITRRASRGHRARRRRTLRRGIASRRARRASRRPRRARQKGFRRRWGTHGRRRRSIFARVVHDVAAGRVTTAQCAALGRELLDYVICLDWRSRARRSGSKRDLEIYYQCRH